MAANNYLTSDSNKANIESELAGFRASDQRREEFVQSLFYYLKELETKNKNLYDELENEQEARRTWQGKARTAQADHDRLTQGMNNGSFTLALIDGDGAVFQDNLLAAAADGGSDAADKLAAEIKSHLQSVDSASSHLPLIVQMYANLEGLSRKLYACGVIKTGHDLYNFVRSFNMSQSFFSIIDVGSGKERADHKLKETLRLYVNNQQCKHVILGGITHDTGYKPNLNPYRHESRFSLLETWASQPDYSSLGFRSFKCPSLFRSEPLPNKPAANPPPGLSLPPSLTNHAQLAPSPSYPAAVQQAVSALQASSLQPSTAPAQLRSQTPPSGGPSPAPMLGTPVQRTSSNSTTGPDQDPTSWATVGKNGTASKNISIAPTVKKERPYVVLNKNYERLDPPISKAKADFTTLQDRIRTHGKVCNYFHVLGRCTDPYCEYKHAPPISESEKVALRIKARQKSCHNMGACRDVLCISGHICPYGLNCNYDDDCFFADTHGVDRNPAVKYYEDGTLEQFRSFAA